MRPMQSTFDENGKVEWFEVVPKPVPVERLQAAMFTDRHDLWPTFKRGGPRRGKPLNGQVILCDTMDERIGSC